MNHADLTQRILALLGPGHDMSPDEVADALRPTTGSDIQPDAGTIAKLVHSDRETLADSLNTILVGDQLSRLLTGVDRNAVEEELNHPFPARSAITVEFLDLLVKRQQTLERMTRLLAGMVLELSFPLARQPRDGVCHSSADRHPSP